MTVDATVKSALDAAELEYRHEAAGRFFVTLPGTKKLQTNCWLIVAEHALVVEAFVCRQPDEAHEEVYRYLLRRNGRLYGVHYSIDSTGDIYLVGRIGLHAVTADELDRVLGQVLEAADGDFNTLLEIGFRTAIRRRRCLLPADGWYEWRRDGDRKQPYFMTRPDGASLALAGIWETWHDPSAEEGAPPLVTCSVLTTEAVGPLTGVHERMPLALPAATWEAWLDPDRGEVAELLVPHRELVDSLELRPVSSAVNDVRNNGAELVAPVADPGDPVALDHASDPG